MPVHKPNYSMRDLARRIAGCRDLQSAVSPVVLKCCFFAGLIVYMANDYALHRSYIWSEQDWLVPELPLVPSGWVRPLALAVYVQRNSLFYAFGFWSFYVITNCVKLWTAKPAIVSRNMSVKKIIDIVSAHGCSNVTSRLDVSSVRETPVEVGGFGQVFSGRMTSGEKVAIKSPRASIPDTSSTRKSLKDLARELYVWSKLQHPNVAALYGLAQFHEFVSIVSPWMEHGNVMKFIENNPSVDRYSLCAQISQGVEYLHKLRVVHGDLKGANILIAEDGTAKIGDFGSSSLYDASVRFTATTGSASFSIRWAAPELLLDKPLLTIESDSYALAMTILEVITGKVPFHEKANSMSVVLAISNGMIPRCPTQLGDLEKRDLWNTLVQCWSKDPTQRKSAGDVHAVVSRLSSSKVMTS